MSEKTLADIVEGAEVTFNNDLPAAIVYVGKVLETQMRTMNEILDRTADLHLRMTNIHVQVWDIYLDCFHFFRDLRFYHKLLFPHVFYHRPKGEHHHHIPHQNRSEYYIYHFLHYPSRLSVL